MAFDPTPIIRPLFVRQARRSDSWGTAGRHIQESQLHRLLSMARSTETGVRHGFAELLDQPESRLYAGYAESVPLCKYEDIRGDVMRMTEGERDVLWPGVCDSYAQSSGTSGGRSKYVPVTPRSLKRNHYAGAFDVVAHYLRQVPDSRLFAGKSFILGGSFASQLHPERPGVKVGDLSATLIDRINPLANLFRIPDKRTALMPDWETKLPALVAASAHADVTNISGVPSWFLTVIRRVMAERGAERISEVWPNLEVFFHGGISFEPYREEYSRICDMTKMHFMETYNASEGFFAVQNDLADPSMLLLIDIDVFYEFIPLGGEKAVPLWEVEPGKTYEMVITSSNGLWRYRLGDTVTVCSVDPVKIRIAGRTRSFINAFGEELMEDNAERGVAEACREAGGSIRNYTAAPVYAADGRRGRHQWLVEWEQRPESVERWRDALDSSLQRLNSDYAAKRAHTIFLDPPEIVDAPDGLFDAWLREAGTHKLGGQRKVPRLSNDRRIIERMLELRRQLSS